MGTIRRGQYCLCCKGFWCCFCDCIKHIIVAIFGRRKSWDLLSSLDGNQYRDRREYGRTK